MADYTTGKQREIVFFYYTPINTKINFQMFKDYNDSVSKEPIDETVADLMINVENMITSSSAFKTQENRPVVNHTKWQAYKTKKVPLTSLFMILNKINGDNIGSVLEETLQYKTFTHQEINQIADVFLGKCIMETKNVVNFINYFKSVMDNMLWYVYDQENKIISFRDTVIDRLENEYNRLTRIAGHIEDVFKNQIKDETMVNRLEGSEDYLKKKNIIISLIKLICSFYNGQIISTTLLTNILNNLKTQYLENPDTRKIYLELWLVLWNNVTPNLSKNDQSTYDNNTEWLRKQMKYLSETTDSPASWDITRLLTIIEETLNFSNNEPDINTLDSSDSSDEDVLYSELKIDEIHKLNNDSDFTVFKTKHTPEMINKYIMKYVLSKCVVKSKQENSVDFSNKISMIKKHLVNTNEFNKLVNELLADKDVICDYPFFKNNIKQYFN